MAMIPAPDELYEYILLIRIMLMLVPHPTPDYASVVSYIVLSVIKGNIPTSHSAVLCNKHIKWSPMKNLLPQPPGQIATRFGHMFSVESQLIIMYMTFICACCVHVPTLRGATLVNDGQ